MNQPRDLIEENLAVFGGSTARLAAELEVSEATVHRWRKGKSRPRPAYEAALRKLLDERRPTPLVVAEARELYHAPSTAEIIGQSLDKTLAEVREILHRKGSLSSRNEALEEVGVILYAHLFSLRHGGEGLRSLRTPAHETAEKMQELVKAALAARNLDKLFINGNRQYLKLGTDENAVAIEIVRAFNPLFDIQSQLLNCEFDVINDVFGRFISDSFIDEKELGQYLTPPEVVQFMAQLAASGLSEEDLHAFVRKNASHECLILDPSCGVGSFLTASAREIARRAVTLGLASSPPEVAEHILRGHCVGIDKSERMWRLAQLSFAMFGQENPELHMSNALARSGPDAKLSNGLEGKARLILTNPPFGASFRANDIVKYRIANTWCRRFPGKIDSEILFMERYLDWLAPGGDLFAIVPDSILTNKGVFQDLRRGLAKEVALREVVSLPAVTFATAGTTTKTSILHFRKECRSTTQSRTRFAVCRSIGYEVVTRGNQRTKKHLGENDLEAIKSELAAHGEAMEFVKQASGVEDAPRWDAQYHSSLSGALEAKMRASRGSLVRVRDVADLVNERLNPLRMNTATFHYVEISDIDSHSNTAIPKKVPTAEAPSRARKVAEFGDVLVSTVRPERGTVGVLMEKSGPVICTTGLAVLRPQTVSSLTLAMLLKSEFVIEQMVRNNVGIAYPAIEEEVLPDIILPVDGKRLRQLDSEAEKVIAAEIELADLRRALMSNAREATASWAAAGV